MTSRLWLPGSRRGGAAASGDARRNHRASGLVEVEGGKDGVGELDLLLVKEAADGPVEAPPFFGANYAEQVDCARAADRVLKDTGFTLDGRPIDFFEVITPPEEIRLPPDNILGVPAGTLAHFAGHGWNVVLRSLPVGLHTLTIHQLNPPPGFPDTLTSIVNVVRRG